MERLTTRNEKGRAVIAGGDSPVGNVQDSMEKLAQYEDTGLTPEQVAALKDELRDERYRHDRMATFSSEQGDKIDNLKKTVTRYPCVHFDNGKCKLHSDGEVTSYCVMGPCPDDTPSNADRIRAMSDEELAEVIRRFCDNSPDMRYCLELEECIYDLDRDEEIPASRCEECVLAFLRRPAEMNGDETDG